MGEREILKVTLCSSIKLISSPLTLAYPFCGSIITIEYVQLLAVASFSRYIPNIWKQTNRKCLKIKVWTGLNLLQESFVDVRNIYGPKYEYKQS